MTNREFFSSKKYLPIIFIIVLICSGVFYYFTIHNSPENTAKRYLTIKYPTMTKFKMEPLSDKGIQNIFHTKFLSSLMTEMLVKDSVRIASIRSEMATFGEYVKKDCYVAVFYYGKDGKIPAAFFVSKDLTKYDELKIIE